MCVYGKALQLMVGNLSETLKFFLKRINKSINKINYTMVIIPRTRNLENPLINGDVRKEKNK